MSEEIELAAEATGKVVAALADESGALAVPREYASYMASRVHLRHMPALVERAMAVAEKIKASGLPRRAFAALDEPLVTTILEGMSEETDPFLRETWENLLANTLTDGPHNAQRAFPGILRALDPIEARYLHIQLHKAVGERVNRDSVMSRFGLKPLNLDNLERLGLIRYESRDGITWAEGADPAGYAPGTFRLTPLAITLLRACDAPEADSATRPATQCDAPAAPGTAD